MNKRPVELLLVEDSPTDAELTIRALKRGRVENTINAVTDGVQALAYLRREPPFENVCRPDLVLLDLNLPRKDGREVLREVRADSDLLRIPIVVLTTSDAEQDIHTSYGLFANAYIVKPVDLRQFFEVVKEIDKFWFSVVTLPLHE